MISDHLPRQPWELKQLSRLQRPPESLHFPNVHPRHLKRGPALSWRPEPWRENGSSVGSTGLEGGGGGALGLLGIYQILGDS